MLRKSLSNRNRVLAYIKVHFITLFHRYGLEAISSTAWLSFKRKHFRISSTLSKSALYYLSQLYKKYCQLERRLHFKIWYTDSEYTVKLHSRINSTTEKYRSWYFIWIFGDLEDSLNWTTIMINKKKTNTAQLLRYENYFASHAICREHYESH